MSENVHIDRVETVPTPREDPMDLSLFLAIAVAVLIACSGYFLFNGMPGTGRDQPRQGRSSRRS
jgi:hypothetical protein